MYNHSARHPFKVASHYTAYVLATTVDEIKQLYAEMDHNVDHIIKFSANNYLKTHAIIAKKIATGKSTTSQ